MDADRILVIQEDAGESRTLRLMAFDHPVEIDFRSPSQASGDAFPLSRYRAVVATLDTAHHGVVETFRRAPPGSAPPLFLFPGDPPLHEVARWIAWGAAQPGEDPALTKRLLSENIEYYSLASLYQQCLKITAAQDEENLLTHVTDTLVHELGAESCVIWLASQNDPDEMMIASVRGLISIDREGSRFFLSQTDWAESIWKGEPFLSHPPASPEGEGRKGARSEQHLYIPLVYREKPIGLIKLGSLGDRRPFSERDVYVARIVADYAATAWRNVNRLARMEKFSLRDRETHAYSEAFLQDYFDKERFKAARFSRPLSLIFIVIENLGFLVEQTRESLVSGALSEMVEAVRQALRDSDLIARVEPNRFCVILPETDYLGSLLATRRLRKAIREKGAFHFLGTEHVLAASLVSATFPRDGRDLHELWKIAEAKHLQQHRSAFHKMHLPEKSLWNAFDIVVGKPEYYDLLRKGKEAPYFARIRRNLGRNSHFCLDRKSFTRMVEAVAQEVVSRGDERGLVIAAGPRPEIFKQILLSFNPDVPEGRKVYVIGQSGSARFDAKNLLYVTAADERLREREILLFLKENGAYGVFAFDTKDEMCGFNTADEWLVDAMMEKVQDLFRIQGTI